MNDLIRPLEFKDLEAVKSFTDMAIGQGYYSMEELESLYQRSEFSRGSAKIMTTLLLEVDGQIKGIRLTYPPGHWHKGKGKGLSPTRWPHPQKDTAYFQSLFIAPELTGKGFGKKLSLKTAEILREIGTKGIVCHSWVESPHNSSGRYLRDLGFQSVAMHPLYWKEVDYTCTRCGKPCLCTAEEMYWDLTKGKT